MDRNLPPGVSVNDIPGNRPEDEAEDNFRNELGQLFHVKYPHHYGTIVNIFDTPLEFALTEYVRMARDLGYNQGFAEGVDSVRMEHIYEREAETNPST